MPVVYERAFRVGYDECDAYGHVNHANYLRYMQEAAFDASADVGYDFATYDTMNRYWLVRETDVMFQRPLVYGDTVIVKTWVADFRRVRSRRMYELRLMSTGEPVAMAHTDWVFLDSTTLRPSSIPLRMVAAFMPDGQSADLIERERFPEPPTPLPGVFRTHRRVKWCDIDRAQHVNNTTYLAYLEDCSVEFVRQEGWPVERMMSAGFGIVARRYRIEYKQAALMDDELEIATWVSDMKRATAVRHYAVSRVSDGQLLARARALWVWVDLKTGKPIRIPSGFKKDLAGNIVQERA
jgi:acyl-CoA thioester hydrolase